MGHAADGFSSILLLSEEHEFALTASFRETGNDLARNICKPYAYTHQRVCNHKSRIFRRNIKRPAVITQQREPVSHGHAADGFSSILLLSEEQETDTDPVNAFASMYAIIKRYFLQKHKTPCCNHTAGRCLIDSIIAYRKIYFNKNSIASTYSSGFTSLPLPQTRCSRTKEIMPMEIPSEML